MPVGMKMLLFIVVIFLLMGLQFAQFIWKTTAHKALVINALHCSRWNYHRWKRTETDREMEWKSTREGCLECQHCVCVYEWTMDSIMSRKIDFIFYNAHLFYCAAAALHFNASLDGSIHCCRWFFFFFYSLLFFRIPLFFSLKISITKTNSTQQKCAAFRLPSIGIFMSAYF